MAGWPLKRQVSAREVTVTNRDSGPVINRRRALLCLVAAELMAEPINAWCAPQPKPIIENRAFWPHFDWNSAELTADGRKEIHAFMEFIAEAEMPETVTLTGHSDTSGPARANLALSKKRVQTVAAELIRLGIPENKLRYAYVGESKPFIDAGDNVREMFNRCVIITYWF